jgi:hypothetical protein
LNELIAEELVVLGKSVFAPLLLVGISGAVGFAVPDAVAEDDVEVFRVYGWSTSGAADRETAADCRSINKTKKDPEWAVARREIADVSDLELPDDQNEGKAYRIFVDYCVRLDAARERPVGAMTFKAARADDLGNVQRWGSRHYRKTSKATKRTPKPGREHFDPPDFDRND